jgi:alkylated DNA repair dioxygenase AlkB
MEVNTLLETESSRLWIVENYFPTDIYEQLENIELNVEPPIKIMGRICRQKRNVGFFSDVSEGYRYSGQIASATPLSKYPILKSILDAVNESMGTSFNGILINNYINGEKCIGAHSDDESGLEKTRNMVVSIAFGATRTFRIRDKKTKSVVLNYKHKPGTLIVMEGDFQKEFTHEIPVEKKVTTPRISLTFRHHIN